MHSLIRRIILPVFYKSQILSLLPMILMCVIAFLLTSNGILFLSLIALGYFIYVISIQPYVPHELVIPDELVSAAIGLLDMNESLYRVDGQMKWVRRLTFSFGQSELDTISIKRKYNAHAVIGMKRYLAWLASCLRAIN